MTGKYALQGNLVEEFDPYGYWPALLQSQQRFFCTIKAMRDKRDRGAPIYLEHWTINT